MSATEQQAKKAGRDSKTSRGHASFGRETALAWFKGATKVCLSASKIVG